MCRGTSWCRKCVLWAIPHRRPSPCLVGGTKKHSQQTEIRLYRRPTQQRRLVFRLTHTHQESADMSTTPVNNGLERVDVLIVGAGISGIGAAHALTTQQPHRTFAILEARGATGGTWDLSAIPAFAPIRTYTPSATSSSRGRTRRRSPALKRSSTTCARRRPNRHRQQDPVPPQGPQRGLVEHGGPLARRGRADRHRRAADDQLWLAVLRWRLLPLQPGIHSPNSRAVSGSAARSCTRSTGPRTSTTAASGWS